MNGGGRTADFTKVYARAVSAKMSYGMAVENMKTIELSESDVQELVGANDPAAFDQVATRFGFVSNPQPHRLDEAAQGEAQLGSLAGFGDTFFACTDNSNLTAQRPSAWQTCTTDKGGGCR